MRALALALCVAVAACAGTRETETASAPPKTAKVIELAPIVSAPTEGELGPIVFAKEDDELPAPCEQMAKDPQHFQFMDDVCKIKRLPEDVDRDFACPSFATSAEATLADGRVVTYRPATEPVAYEHALEGVVPKDVKIAVILVRRVSGVPHYRYLSNGTEEVAFQSWSATKHLAIANAAATLRARSGGKVGLTSSVDLVPLGDLVTTVHNYVERYYSSNALAKYFHDVGGRARINELLHDKWLHRPSHESLGGNYGPGFTGFGFTFRESDGKSVTVPRDPGLTYDNHVSAHTLVESLKRLVMHREDEETRLPAIAWADLRVLFYGAESSKWYPGEPGGMSADRSVYFQTFDFDGIVRRSQGKFRVFAKSGMGAAQFVHVGYACFPALDEAGAAIANEGREIFVSARVDGPGGYVENDRILARAYRAVIARAIDGRI